MSVRNYLPCKIGKKEIFGLDVFEWTQGAPLASYNVSNTDGKLTIVDQSVSLTAEEHIIIFSATGVSAGTAEVHFEWATANKSNCEEMLIDVIPCD